MSTSRFLVVAIALLALVAALSAQTTTGAITGTVIDPSGAAVPNVRVTATNTATNLINSTQSNDAGVYNFPFLALGEYTITAEAQGFKKTVLGPFRLEVNQIARVDPKLEVGAITESVQVSDVAAVLQTETTQTGSVLSSTKLTEIPLNGRNFANLTLLVPGAVSVNPQNMSTSGRIQDQGSRPYVNGNREQTNNFLLDGIDINDSVDNRIAYQPNVDALEEVKVLTGNAPAEFGNAAGAVVNAQLKSGTNEFHGNLFEFLRNDKLDANDFFNNRSGAPKRAYRRNIFGGTLGGPIKKNKAFFFVDYEGTRQHDSGASLVSVPLAEYRNGDLSRFSQTIRDPLNGQPFAGKIIPPSRIVNPVAKALFADPTLYPLPNQTGLGAIGVTNDYRGTSANALQNDQADAKVDVRPTEKDNISARWSISRYFSGGSAVAIPALMTTAKNGPTTAAVATWTRTFSATIVNEFRAGYSRDVIGDLTIDPAGRLGADGNSKLGIPGGQPIAGASAIQIGDGMTIVGSAATIGETVENKYQIGNNLTISRGRHFLKMGGQIIPFQQNRYYAGNNGALGFFDFTAAKYSGSGFADFLLNQLSEKGRGSVAGKWGHRHSRAGIFFQDDWKAAKNLTVNLGIRWEYTQPVYEVADRQSNFDLATGQQLFAGKDGNSRALFNAYYKQFMPRVGIAWQPNLFKNKMVVRAGYAIISFLEGTGANLRLPLNPPIFFESDTIYDLNKPGDIKLGFTDVLPLSTPSGNVRAWDPNLRPQFTQQWNLTIEQQFTPSFSLSVGYVGQKATHLIVPREGNQPLPGTGPVSTWAPLQTRRPLYSVLPLVTTIATTDSPSTMDFHSLQASARKRMGHGLEFVGSYTFGKTLTDNRGFYGGGGFIAGEGAYWQNAYNRKSDRGRSFFDARHNLSLGGTWDIPVGQNRAVGTSMSKVADLIVGGWNTSFMLAAHSGFPLTIIGLDSTNQAVRGNVRPNYYRALTYQNQSIDNWFGTGNTFCGVGVDDGKCAYGYAAAGQFGNASIATEQAPSYFGFDTSIGKRFKLGERRALEFRAEMFNIANHASFGPPGRTLTSPSTFGLITTQTTLPRQIQFGLKFFF